MAFQTFYIGLKKFSLRDSPSTLTNEDVLGLFRSANISTTNYEFLIPKTHHQVNCPPPGYTSVFKQQILNGLRFPLHSLLIDICRRLQVSPTQLSSNAHSKIVGFILSANLHDVPVTADYFFSLFSLDCCVTCDGDLIIGFEEQRPGLTFLDGYISAPCGWQREFFFIKPMPHISRRTSRPCVAEWMEDYCSDTIDYDLIGSCRDFASRSGMLARRFRVTELIQKDLLVHGGIEPGVPSPQFTFRYLMHRAAVNKFKLYPEDKPKANSANTAANKRPLSLDAGIPNALTYPSAATHASKVRIHDMSSSSLKDAVPLEEGEVEKDHTSAHKKAKCVVLVSDENQHQSTPASLLAISKTLESVFVPKECFEKSEKEKQEVTFELTSTKAKNEELEQEIKLYKANRVDTDYKTSQAMVKVKILEKCFEKSEKEKQEVTSELASTKAKNEELEEEIKLYKANRVDTDNRTSQAMVKVKTLEKRLETAKSDSDKIKTDAIEEFKSSDDFANAVHEEAVKYYINGFETCKLRLVNSGKLPSGFNFDFVDVADAELDSSSGPKDNVAVDPDEKSLKLEKA